MKFDMEIFYFASCHVTHKQKLFWEEVIPHIFHEDYLTSVDRHFIQSLVNYKHQNNWTNLKLKILK